MLDAAARRRIVEAAWRLRGVPYDFSHRDESWKKLNARPTALDCSKLLCRVACEALGHGVDTLAANAGWLLDHLARVDGTVPAPGDVVGYCRNATRDERFSAGPLVWHVMIFLGRNKVTGRDTVLGACDLAGRVAVRPIVYEQHWGPRRWRRIDRRITPPTPYRRIEPRAAY